jgi:hypothetical protein
LCKEVDVKKHGSVKRTRRGMPAKARTPTRADSQQGLLERLPT